MNPERACADKQYSKYRCGPSVRRFNDDNYTVQKMCVSLLCATSGADIFFTDNYLHSYIQDERRNVCRSSREVSLLLLDFRGNWKALTHFNNTQYKIFITHRLQLQTDTHTHKHT